jgi:hypothetical protein
MKIEVRKIRKEQKKTYLGPKRRVYTHHLSLGLVLIPQSRPRVRVHLPTVHSSGRGGGDGGRVVPFIIQMKTSHPVWMGRRVAFCGCCQVENTVILKKEHFVS